VQALTTTQIASLSTSAVNTLTTSQFVALTSDQAMSLSTNVVATLTSAQVSVLSTDNIHALTTNQVVALSTANLVIMSTDQVAAMTLNQLCALTQPQYSNLTPAQKNALSPAQFAMLASGTPLVLDLNGDGVRTLNIDSGTKFDLFATGQQTQTGWASPQDGLLVIDRNQDGLINNGSELFGAATQLSSGGQAANGYVALSEMDTNGDGAINHLDAQWAAINVWIDSNSDGISQSGELKSLDALGIASINLKAATTSISDNGNLLGLVSDYQTTDGVRHAMADVWFATDRLGSSQNLQSQVSELATAIAGFKETQTATVQTIPSTATTSTGAAAPLAVNAIANSLKQFDVNGNALPSVVQATDQRLAVALTKSENLALSGYLAPASTAILAASTSGK